MYAPGNFLRNRFGKSNSRPAAPYVLHDFSILNCYLKCFSPDPPELGYEGELGLEGMNPWPRRNDNKKTILANLSLQSHKSKEFSNIPEDWATLCMKGTLLCSHLKKQRPVHLLWPLNPWYRFAFWLGGTKVSGSFFSWLSTFLLRGKHYLDIENILFHH